ncbi:MAG: Holliday junction branch migration protein RuvA [Oscillospiraceae bacterium]|jgi:Holliday junction DNA helicase RuvA|nr:Holliday junction branch migration protein RuvA [Oscillospiraceae bacterium]
MIYSVKGNVIHTEPNLAVIEAGGVGFACRTTANTLSQLTALQKGAETRLFTYLHVREDAVELFGFGSNEELRAFKLLITVSGVGPKAALSILSDLSPQGFTLCVASGDSKLLTRSQGIGTKIAQRIVLELKDKIDPTNGFSLTDGQANSVPAGSAGNNASEAIAALSALGFTTAQAAKALEGADRTLPTSELVKLALKKIGN